MPFALFGCFQCQKNRRNMGSRGQERKNLTIPHHVQALLFPSLQLSDTKTPLRERWRDSMTRKMRLRCERKENVGNCCRSAQSVDCVSGSYQLQQQIGQGGYSTVYLARHCGGAGNQTVAVKLLKKDKCGLDMATTELRVLALAVGCPFVIQILDCFQTPLYYGLVLTFVSGGTLHTRIQHMGKFSETIARFYVAEISEGLFFLHDASVIHRDLNLHNVLLSGAGHVQLCDFGLSHVGAAGEELSCPPWSDCPAAPQLPAPELLSGKSYSKTVDWWSLGVMLYRMICGTYPLAGTVPGRACELHQLSVLAYTVEPFPAPISWQAKTFLQKLLTRDCRQRLGHGATERQDVCNADFFRTLDWQQIRDQTIPVPVTGRLCCRRQ